MSPPSTAHHPATGDLEILASPRPTQEEILTPDACAFLTGLFRTFEPRRREILAHRAARQSRWAAGGALDFLPETATIRAGSWRVPPPPPDLLDRSVEITGPVDRETALRALTSGANAYMADLEDFTSPTWENLLAAQAILRQAVRRTLDRPERPARTNRSRGETGAVYALGGDLATLHVRPRGWHLSERHVLFAGEPVSAALFDWGLAFFHNAVELLARGSGPYVYLPKLEGHLEAQLWNDVFLHSQGALGLPAGTIRATAMIETLPAVFEAEEILHALGPHALGLNCGRWDYLFSTIKTLGAAAPTLPDRSRLTMDAPFLQAYCRHVLRVCHRRGAAALGGMAAQLPLPGDEEGTARAYALVQADKEREAAQGFDGAAVGHPALVPFARAAFARRPAAPTPFERGPDEAEVTRAELLDLPTGSPTEAGVRLNLRVGLRYITAWLGGLGCVPIDGKIEDVATAEISRAQLWQWLRRGVALEDGRTLTRDLFDRLLREEMSEAKLDIGPGRVRAERLYKAADLLRSMSKAPEAVEFWTLTASEELP